MILPTVCLICRAEMQREFWQGLAVAVCTDKKKWLLGKPNGVEGTSPETTWLSQNEQKNQKR
jgi:hypothetical protein